MSTLSESQIKEIREYWDNENSLNNAIIKLVPGDERRKASEAAIDVLVLDGIVSEHEVEEWKQHKYAARWGGEHANLWMRMLLDRSERVLEQWKDQIYDAGLCEVSILQAPKRWSVPERGPSSGNSCGGQSIIGKPDAADSTHFCCCIHCQTSHLGQVVPMQIG